MDTSLNQDFFNLARGLNKKLLVKHEPWAKKAALPLDRDFDLESARAKILAYTVATIEADAPYLPSSHIYVHFGFSPMGQAVAKLEVGIFGNISSSMLGACLPEYRVLRTNNVGIDIMISNDNSGASTIAIDLFSANDGEGPAYQPTLSIFFDETDLGMKKIRDPQSFVEEIAESIARDYQKVISKVERYAANLILPNEF